MSPTRLLLKAYYERLHERMQSKLAALSVRIDELLSLEIEMQGFGPIDEEKHAAYRQAALAFVDERLESYNPIGIQYTFDRAGSREVAELEFQLNWYNSRPEFEDLVQTVRALTDQNVRDEMLPDLADRVISQVGAFPDKSIIVAYAAGPALQKLPDYVVACAVEEVVCGRRPAR